MMNSKIIISACKVAFVFVFMATSTTTTTTTTMVSASTMESSSLRGGNPTNIATSSSISESTEIAHLLFSSVTDTVRKLWVGCSNSGDSNQCNEEEYNPVMCKGRVDGKKVKGVYRSKCHAKKGGFKKKKFDRKCEAIEECIYFERGRNTDPVFCNGRTWPDKCVAEKYGECKF